MTHRRTVRRRHIFASLSAVGIVAATVAALGGGTAAAAPAYTTQTLHFRVTVGPVGKQQTCDIVGDVYTPASATAAQPVPAILTTNGFGGSKDDQAGLGKYLASNGYVVLSYSGLGFGGSTCKITLDDPDYDGLAGKQLVSYLGGAPGIAFTDAKHTAAAPPLTVVRKDARDHDGRAAANDPRVGMIGGSYGGQVQFATASVDPRVDTIVPMITWNDLSYSLGPNSTAQTSGVSSSTPGATKLIWGLAFSGEGVVQGLLSAKDDPSRLYPCPNFADFVCPALLTGATTGHLGATHVDQLRHASVASYVDRIKVPVLLMQGQTDTLFNLNEASATYQALRAQGTPVKMIWDHWGHSGGSVPGEVDLSAPDPKTQYLTARAADWFAHYLKGSPVSTGPQFSWFRDWVPYDGSAAPAYASADAFPAGTGRTWMLSGNGELTTASPATSSRSFLTPPAGVPTSLDPLDVVGSLSDLPELPNADLPGTFARWTTPTLTDAVDVVGSPTVRMKISAPTAALTQAAGPDGQVVLFVKVEDVAPDGSATTIHGLEAPTRVPDVSKAFTVRLPGIVHRFAAGHRIRLVVAGGSPNYRGNLVATPVSIAGGSNQTLTLPVVR